MSRYRRLATLLLVLVASVVVAATALARGTGANVVGKGRLVYTSVGDATVFATDLRAGARIAIDGNATLTTTCVSVSKRRPCVRFDIPTHATVVLRPIRFLVDGTAFTVTLVSSARFSVGITGAGRVALDGRGTYTVDGVGRIYRGRRTLLLAG